MRNVLIRLLIMVSTLTAACYTQAITLHHIDDLARDTTYYVYDGSIITHGSFSVVQYETPLWGIVMLYDKKADQEQLLSGGTAHAHCSENYPVWAHTEHQVQGNPFTINECPAPLTWLTTMVGQNVVAEGHGVERVEMQVGPEGTAIKPPGPLNSSHAPADLTWKKNTDYVLRYYALSNSDPLSDKTVATARSDRTFRYMGAPSATDATVNNQDISNTGHFVINLVSQSPKSENNQYDYFLNCSSYITDKTDNLTERYIAPGSNWASLEGSESQVVEYETVYHRYQLTINLNPESPGTPYKTGHDYSVRTVCFYVPNDASYVILSNPRKTAQTFNHEFKVQALESKISIISSLTGHFLVDGSIYVQGKFDDSSPDQPKFKYAVKESASQTANWVAPARVIWNPGNTNPRNCPKCFSFTIPASNVSAKDKISLVQVLPDEHSSEQAAHPDVAAFTLQELANVGFANAQGETWACGTENEVTAAKDNSGTSLIKVKLTVKHAVDNITGNIWLPSLPVTYKGHATVSYAAAGQSAVATSDIVITENDKGKTAVNWAASTADKVLKPGVYVITLPVDVPAYRQEDVGPELLTLYANVYGAKSILLKQRDSSPDPAYVQCQDMFNGAVP